MVVIAAMWKAAVMGAIIDDNTRGVYVAVLSAVEGGMEVEVLVDMQVVVDSRDKGTNSISKNSRVELNALL